MPALLLVDEDLESVPFFELLLAGLPVRGMVKRTGGAGRGGALLSPAEPDAVAVGGGGGTTAAAITFRIGQSSLGVLCV